MIPHDGKLPIARMLKDADALQEILPWGSLLFDTLAGDCVCHVRALASEVERLQKELSETESVLSDMRQDSTAFLRGVTFGMLQVGRVAHESGRHDCSDTIDQLAEEAIRQGVCLPLDPSWVSLTVGTMSIEVDNTCMGTCVIDGCPIPVTKAEIVLKPGNTPDVRLTIAPMSLVKGNEP